MKVCASCFFFLFFTYYLLFTVYISALVANKDIYKLVCEPEGYKNENPYMQALVALQVYIFFINGAQ